MIKVYDNYVIDVDQYNYTAQIDMHKTTIDKKTGEEKPTYKFIGYYRNLRAAVAGIVNYEIKQKFIKQDMELSEAVIELYKIADRIESVINEIPDERSFTRN